MINLYHGSNVNIDNIDLKRSKMGKDFGCGFFKENTTMSEDVQFQVECLSTELVEMLMNKYGWDIRKALDELYSSETYKRLCNPICGLYYESAVYVFSYLQNEIETGVVK